MPASEAPTPRAVLLVDDDVAFASVIAGMLIEQGYRPEMAHDHAQATDRLSHTEYPVAIIDLVLPGGDGIALADHIRARSPMVELQAGAGSQFDPRLVRLLVAEYPERAPGLP